MALIRASKALKKLLPMQRRDFAGLFKAMDGYPVVIRTLDPPLHEFVPKREEIMVDLAKLPHAKIAEKREMSDRYDIAVKDLKKKLGLTVTSEPTEKRGRVYRIVERG